jgi:hypothetical protein
MALLTIQKINICTLPESIVSFISLITIIREEKC